MKILSVLPMRARVHVCVCMCVWPAATATPRSDLGWNSRPTSNTDRAITVTGTAAAGTGDANFSRDDGDVSHRVCVCCEKPPEVAGRFCGKRRARAHGQAARDSGRAKDGWSRFFFKQLHRLKFLTENRRPRRRLPARSRNPSRARRPTATASEAALRETVARVERNRGPEPLARRAIPTRQTRN